jgi:hypothetical protein
MLLNQSQEPKPLGHSCRRKSFPRSQRLALTLPNNQIPSATLVGWLESLDSETRTSDSLEIQGEDIRPTELVLGEITSGSGLVTVLGDSVFSFTLSEALEEKLVD